MAPDALASCITWSSAAMLLIIKTKQATLLCQNSYIFFLENAFENVVWKMAAILSQPICVKIISIMSSSTTISVIK